MRDAWSRLAALPGKRRELARALLAEQGLDLRIAPASTGDAPASLEQEALWIHQQCAPDRVAYHEAVAIDLWGDLHLPTLRASVELLVRRHDTLRTRFVLAGSTLTQIVDADAAISSTLLVEHADGLSETEVDARLRREIRSPFALRADAFRGDAPPWRGLLLRTAPARHVLLFVLHHLIADGPSLTIFAREMGIAYSALRHGRSPELPPLHAQYVDYARRQREQLTSTERERLTAFWCNHLRDAPRFAAPPASIERPGGRHRFTAPASLATSVERCAREHDCTVFMVLLAAFATTLCLESGARDVPIATDFARRDRAAFEPLIGFFVNQIVLRVDLTGDPDFHGLLRRVREESLLAYRHHALPFAALASAIGAEGLFSAKLVWQDTRPVEIAMDGLAATVMDLHSGDAKFDLLVNAWGSSDLTVSIDYARDRYDVARVMDLSDAFERVLTLGTSDPAMRVSAIIEAVTTATVARRRQLRHDLRASNLERLRAMTRRDESW